MTRHRPTVIFLMGPTASGKTDLAIALRQHLPVELISVDSALVYRGMDIGTAKPSASEQQVIRHHLLDIRDPAESYSAAAFRRDALQCAAEIRARGHLPLLAGGTMLYFKALRDGLNNLPTANPEIRAELEAQATLVGWPAMHATLAEIDPVTASRLAPNDSQRVGRALEIWRISGKPMSELLGEDQQTDAPVPTITISLEPSDRSVLHARIEQRFDLMLKQGFVEEVRVLHQRQELHTSLPSIRCVGYRQVWSMLDGEITQAQAREQSIAATRQLAKRQLTWLRSQQNRQVIDCLSPHAVQDVIKLISTLQDRHQA